MNPLVLAAIPKLIDKIANYFPSEAEKNQAQAELINATVKGDLDFEELRSKNITAEAASSDKWTSRARPSFLYVVYVMILTSIPMGVLSAFQPEMVVAIINGTKLWLEAIPDELYTLFGVVATGYVGARSWEKVRGVSK